MNWSVSKQLIRSDLGSEAIVFANAFDIAQTIKYDLQDILTKAVRLQLLTGSLSIFDVIISNQVKQKKVNDRPGKCQKCLSV